MKFSLVRPALALGVALTLASCGGGGKATYPINVTVYNLQYPGLVLTTSAQDLQVATPATPGDTVTTTFPSQIEYGTVYTVLPKTQPAHQTCSPGTPSNIPNYYSPTGTAGLLEKIDIRYICSVKTAAIGGTIKGLAKDGLVLTNGSSGATYVATPSLDATTKVPADIPYFLVSGGAVYGAPYKSSYGVTVLTQPAGQTCTVANGVGEITDAVETAGKVGNVDVTCVNNP